VQELSSGNARSTALAEVIRPGREVTRSPQLGQHPVSAVTRTFIRLRGQRRHANHGHHPSGFRSANNDLDQTPTAPQTNTGTQGGTLYRTTGPTFNTTPFLPTAVTATAVGMATFTLTDRNTGTSSSRRSFQPAPGAW
jgi:hypothetical protein